MVELEDKRALTLPERDLHQRLTAVLELSELDWNSRMSAVVNLLGAEIYCSVDNFAQAKECIEEVKELLLEILRVNLERGGMN
jgi:hypothetical protein